MKKHLIDRWLDWHAKNPEFYQLFEKFALEAAAAKQRKLSAWLITNRVRWEASLVVTATEPGQLYRIPNDFIALFARKFMVDHPEFDGFFDTRDMTKVSPQELKDAIGVKA